MALPVFLAFVDSLYLSLVCNDDMAVTLGYWVPFTSWYASSCPVGAPLARLEGGGVLRDTTLSTPRCMTSFLHERQDTDLDMSLAQTTFHVRHLFVSTGTHANVIYLQSKLAIHAGIPSCFPALR